MQERAGISSSNSVQAPHTPCSQPRWVPVRLRLSRRKSARWVRGSTEASTARVFTVSDGGKVGLPLLGQFKVAGMTEADAEAAITRAFELQFGLRSVPVSVLRLGPRQEAEPTVASEPNARPTQQVPQRRR